MPEIIRARVSDSVRLDVDLDNGNSITVDMQPLLRDQEYIALIKDRRFLYPKTDGKRIYWKAGPSITIEQILLLVAAPADKIISGRNSKC